MKKLILFLSIINTFVTIAQNWKVATPFNNANVIRDMETTPDGTLYVIADQTHSMYKKALTSPTWSKMNVTNTSVFGNPSDMQMLNNTTGYAISNGGRLAKTTNGWQTSLDIITSTSHNRIFFLNENVGYIFGYKRFIRKTIDSGITWTNLSIPSSLISTEADLTDLEFINENIGFAISTKGSVFKTVDQGVTWTKIQLQASNYALKELVFVDENIGLATGPFGQIYRTINQGVTWSMMSTSGGLIHDIRFINGVLYATGENRSFIKSTNLGVTWSDLKTVTTPSGGTG
ncbi:MAG: YCF48-related protein, partial [Candidatus Paceibacterota bacterium]